MNVVVDTNVLVSGLLKPFSASGKIVSMIADGKLLLCYDARILLEYDQVLRRKKFGFDENLVTIFLDAVKSTGVCTAGTPLALRLPDTDDEMFVEAAINSKSYILVTGNSRHFPKKLCSKVRIFTPTEFLIFCCQ